MIDEKKIEEAVKLLLEGMGEDHAREGLAETPARIARMYKEIYAGYEEDAAVHLSNPPLMPEELKALMEDGFEVAE